MDLSFTRFEKTRRAGLPAAGIGALLAGVSARQAASPTAAAQAAIGFGARTANQVWAPTVLLFAHGVHSVSGSFSSRVAASLTPGQPT